MSQQDQHPNLVHEALQEAPTKLAERGHDSVATQPQGLPSDSRAEFRVCSSCQETLIAEMFSGSRLQCKRCRAEIRHNYYIRNRTSIRQRQQAHRQANADAHRKRGYAWRKNNSESYQRMQRKYLLKRFGMTPEEYDLMLISQGGVCAICGRTPEENGKALAVDHDHTCCPDLKKSCGKCVRGLLCQRCNQAIGQFEDDTRLFVAVISYLTFSSMS